MKEVFVLLRRIYDPYGCLEDNEMDIVGIFTTKELAEEGKQIKENEDKRKRFDYWVDNYDPNKTIHNPKGDGGIIGLNGRVFVGKNGN